MRFRKVKVGYDGKPVEGLEDVELFDRQDMTDLVNGNQLGYNHFARNPHISRMRREKEIFRGKGSFYYGSQVSDALYKIDERLFTLSQLRDVAGGAEIAA